MHYQVISLSLYFTFDGGNVVEHIAYLNLKLVFFYAKHVTFRCYTLEYIVVFGINSLFGYIPCVLFPLFLFFFAGPGRTWIIGDNIVAHSLRFFQRFWIL